MTEAVCDGCGDAPGTNYDCCLECSIEVAMSEVCPSCGWGLGANPLTCVDCREAELEPA